MSGEKSLLEKLAEAKEVSSDGYAKAEQFALLIFKNGDEVVDMVLHPLTDTGFETDLASGVVIEELSGNVTSIVLEGPTGCWEASFYARAGDRLNAVREYVPKGAEMQWVPCQRGGGN